MYKNEVQVLQHSIMGMTYRKVQDIKDCTFSTGASPTVWVQGRAEHHGWSVLGAHGVLGKTAVLGIDSL